jgi:hypothetical protein
LTADDADDTDGKRVHTDAKAIVLHPRYPRNPRLNFFVSPRSGGVKTANPKSEYRNPKQIRITEWKKKIRNTRPGREWILEGILDRG